MCGGGSNAMGAFTAFLNDPEVKLVGVEPAGHGLNTDKHSATLTLGKPSQLHGMACYVLEDEQGSLYLCIRLLLGWIIQA